MSRRTKISSCLAILLGTATGCAHSSDYAQFPNLLATNLDTRNGTPVEVAPMVRCGMFLHQICADLPEDAQHLAAAFADVVDVPLVPRGEFEDPPCAWATKTTDERAGLRATLGFPEIQGDTAKIHLGSACERFRQVHLFTFVRDPEGDWTFVSRQLVSIT